MTSTDTPTGGATRVTIEHKFGETTIEQHPERVATVGLTDYDAFLALGVTPGGVTDWFGEQPHATWPWAPDELVPRLEAAVDGDPSTEAAPATPASSGS